MTTTVPHEAAPGPTVPQQPAPHQALYRVWRAQAFSGIVGQEATVAALRNAVRTGRVAHALLFVGPRGTGKTSMARIVAKALNCTDLHDGEPCDRCVACVSIREGTSLDVAEMDAASNNKVDDMRELLPRIATAPSDLRRKVFIIDEVQRIKEGWDVLLKTLEEPPDHVAFIFCTTDAGQIRPAILSRVQRYDFRKLTVDQIAGKLRHILAEIGREADDESIDLIARAAAGGMRDAESMLDQLLAGASERLTADRVRDTLGLAGAEAVEGFVEALLAPDPLAGLAILDGLDERGRDARTFLDQVMELVRARLVAALAGRTDGSVEGRALSTTVHRLTAVGRRLASIDPARLGPGGLGFQLELALLGETSSGEGSASATSAAPGPAAPRIAPTPQPVAADRSSTSAGRPPETPVPRPARPPAIVTPPAPVKAARVEPSAPVAPAPARPAATPSAAPAIVPPVAAAVPTTASAVPVVAAADMDGLLAAWPTVVREMSRLPALRQLIVESRPIALDGNVVTLGFPEGRAFLRDAADRRRSSIEEGLARVIGRPVAVKCVLTNLAPYPPLADDADAERLLAEARRIFADDLADVGEVG